MNEEHNKLVGYCMDEPEAAARELARLREDARWSLVISFLIGLLVGLWFG